MRTPETFCVRAIALLVEPLDRLAENDRRRYKVCSGSRLALHSGHLVAAAGMMLLARWLLSRADPATELFLDHDAKAEGGKTA